MEPEGKNMSILIKDMEMPRPKLAGMVAVYTAYIVVKHNGDVKIVVDNEDKTDSTEYSLVPVPPHGRLIDADELLRATLENFFFYFVPRWMVKEAPTVIPADKDGER